MVNSRRTFLSSSAQIMGAGWLAVNWPAIAAAASQGAAHPQTFANFSAAQARDLDAMAAQIIPSDDTPGAREAGTVSFIDRALSSFYGAHRADFLADYAAFAQQSPTRFADLSPQQQIETLRRIESSRFFGALRFLTVLGFLASPSYGGNRERIGWHVIGFNDEHHFSPPFGYYDRDYPGFVPYDKEKPA
jgi:gluconate 2-dehydrogenase gamma chain